MSVKKSPPLFQMGFLACNSVTCKPGQEQAWTEQKVHCVLVAARVWLEIIHYLIDLKPVAAVVRGWYLSSRKRCQPTGVDLMEKLLCLAKRLQELLLHINAMVRPRRKIP